MTNFSLAAVPSMVIEPGIVEAAQWPKGMDIAPAATPGKGKSRFSVSRVGCLDNGYSFVREGSLARYSVRLCNIQLSEPF